MQTKSLMDSGFLKLGMVKMEKHQNCKKCIKGTLEHIFIQERRDEMRCFLCGHSVISIQRLYASGEVHSFLSLLYCSC